MSNSIDERIVQMQFDNKKFENGVSESLKTLEKLKGATDFKTSTKSFGELEDAARRLNFSNLENSVKSLTDRFSTLGIVGMTALQNITNKAIDAGERLVKSLTIDQVSSGWDKYADKTSAVQTIMAATAKDFSDTGVQMAYVNEQLSKLNWFTDETSYSFLDMVSNIGKFTSNSVALDTSVTAMQGISTWAAISGANVNEASRAMYNLAQAISVGSVKLIDWKSIENANMATAEFKETVIETALELGTLEKSADGTIKTLGKKGKEVSVSDFNSQLSEGWFTSDVLLKSLDKYGAFTDRLYEVTEETGTTATEFLGYIEDYQNGVIDLELVSKKTGVDAEKLGGYLSELTDDTYALGLKAFKAAQEAKTFGEAISSVKDAVSTGWMNTFELIFGDYTEAKKLWTDLANSLWDIFAAGGEARNELLEGWRNIKRVKEDYVRSWSTDEYYLNEFGHYVYDASQRIEELDGRTVLIEGVTNAFSALLSVGSAVKYSLRSIFPPMTSERLYDLTENFRDFTTNLKTYLSFDSDIIDAADDEAEAFKGMSKPIQYLVRVFKGLSSVGKIVVDAFKMIGKGVSNFIKPMSPTFDKIGELFAKLGDKLVGFKDRFENSEFYKNGFSDFFGVLGASINDFLTKDVSSESTFLDKVKSKLEAFNPVFDWIKDKITNTEFYKTHLKDFFGILGTSINDFLTKDVSSEATFLDKVKSKLEAFNPVFDWIKDKFDNSQVVKALKERFDNFVSIFDDLKKRFENSSFGEFFQVVTDSVNQFLTKDGSSEGSIFENIKTKIGSFSGIFDWVREKLSNISTNFSSFSSLLGYVVNPIISGFNFLATAVNKLWSFVTGKFSFSTIVGIIKTLISVAIPATILRNLYRVGNIGKELRKGLESIGEGIGNIFSGPMSIFSKGRKDFSDKILKVAIALGVLSAAVTLLASNNPQSLKMAGITIAALAGGLLIFAGAMMALDKFSGEDIDLKTSSKGLIKISAAILILSAAVKILSGVKLSTTATLGIILAELFTFSLMMNKFSGNNDIKTGPILSLSASLIIISFALKNLSSLSWEDIGKGLAGMGGALVLLAGVTILLSRLAKDNSSSQVGTLLSLSGSLSIISDALTKLSALSWEDIGKGLLGMGIALALLSKSVTSLSGFSETKFSSPMITMIGLSANLLIVSKVLKNLSSLSWEDIGKGLAGMGGALVILVGMTAALSKFGGSNLRGSISLVVISSGLLIAANSLSSISELSWTQIGRGLTAMLGVSTILLGITAAINHMPRGTMSIKSMGSVVVSIIALAASMGVFVKALKALDGYSGPDILRSMTAFSLMIGSIGAVTAGMGVVTSKIGFGKVALGGLALALSELMQVGFVALIGAINDWTEGGFEASIESGGRVIKATMDALKIFVEDVGSATAFGGTLLLSGLIGSFGVSGFKLLLGQLILSLSALMSVVTVDLAGLINDYFTGDETVSMIDKGAEVLGKTAEALSNFVGAGDLDNPYEGWSYAGTALASIVGAALTLVGQVIADVGALVSTTVLGLIGSSDDWIASIENGKNAVIMVAESIGGFGGAIKGAYEGQELESFSSHLPAFGDNLSAFADGLKPFSAMLVLKAAMVGKVFAQLEKSLAPQNGVVQFFAGEQNIGDFGARLSEFGTGLNEFASALGDVGVSDIQSIVNVVKSLVDISNDATEFDWGGLSAIALQLEGIAGQAFTAFVAPFTDADGEMENAGVNAISNFVNGVGSKNSDIIKTSSSIVTSTTSQLSKAESLMRVVGANAVQGYINGLKSKLSQVRSVASQIGQVTRSATMVALNSHSPSREMYQIGDYAVQGYVNALRDGLTSVSDISADLGNESILSLQDALSQLNSLIEDGVAVQPTITPIFDMSNLGDAANEIDSAFGVGSYGLNVASTPSIQRTAQFASNYRGSTNAPYNNSDILDAIDKLGTEIKGLKIVLDTGATVGGLSSKLDQKLGQRAVYRSRGN